MIAFETAHRQRWGPVQPSTTNAPPPPPLAQALPCLSTKTQSDRHGQVIRVQRVHKSHRILRILGAVLPAAHRLGRPSGAGHVAAFQGLLRYGFPQRRCPGGRPFPVRVNGRVLATPFLRINAGCFAFQLSGLEHLPTAGRYWQLPAPFVSCALIASGWQRPPNHICRGGGAGGRACPGPGFQLCLRSRGIGDSTVPPLPQFITPRHRRHQSTEDRCGPVGGITHSY